MVVPMAVAAVILAVDQLTKHWAVSTLDDGSIIELVWTLQFRLTFNTGMSFGMGAGWGPLVAPLASLVVVALVWTIGRIPNTLGLVAVGMIVGGAVGNLVDRALRAGDGFLGGAVVDFIDLQWWPVFNVADMGIVVGAVLLVIATWNHEPDGDADPSDAPSTAERGTDADAPRDAP